MKFYKMMFSLTLTTSILITISSISWVTAWAGLEMNLLSILPMMKNFKNKFSSEATIKYFITQTIASTMMIFSILFFSNMKMFSFHSETPMMYLILSSLLLKMGAAPLHFWLPEVISGLSWNLTMTVLTIQKMAPMILTSYTTIANNLTMMTILTSATISGIIGMNQTCLRKIMTYSSINNIGWMLSALMMSNSLWLMYFLTYTLITLSITVPFNLNKMMFIPQLTKLSNNKMSLLIMMMNFLSLGGLPPFTGFMPKWITIYMLSTKAMFYLTITLILATLTTLFMYLRLMLPMAMMHMNKSMKLKTTTISKKMTTLNMISLLGMPFFMMTIQLF
uniref:NADH-ubiquinone oxidoreductase chain 2 n=1 Tax=Scolytinae sp. BMNH 1274292 TaxID=2558040 RepID=A0A126TFB9_9CUCU|nr:NADH dehydrogenase subunit 2 [Scolytinae sp. BMNH 1274292]